MSVLKQPTIRPSSAVYSEDRAAALDPSRIEEHRVARQIAIPQVEIHGQDGVGDLVLLRVLELFQDALAGRSALRSLDEPDGNRLLALGVRHVGRDESEA